MATKRWCFGFLGLLGVLAFVLLPTSNPQSIRMGDLRLQVEAKWLPISSLRSDPHGERMRIFAGAQGEGKPTLSILRVSGADEMPNAHELEKSQELFFKNKTQLIQRFPLKRSTQGALDTYSMGYQARAGKIIEEVHLEFFKCGRDIYYLTFVQYPGIRPARNPIRHRECGGA